MYRFRVTLSAVALVLLVGCFEVEQEYTINPDGSGKVVHTMTRMDILGQGESGLPDLLQSTMGEAKGVDAWSDVDVRMTDDGSMQFTGTAWFSDLNALQIDNMLSFGWEPMGDQRGRLFLRTSADTETTTSTPPDDIEAEIAKARNEWKQSRPMMQGMLGSLSWKAMFNLPASVTEESGFVTNGNNATFELEGQSFFEALDSLMNDDAFLEAQARAGGFDPNESDEALPVELVKGIYGEGGVYLVTSAGRDQFDYVSEFYEALEGQAAMMEALPIGSAGQSKPLVPPAQGGDFERLEVIETQFVSNGDLSWSSEGATIQIYGVFPGSVIDTRDGELRIATSDTGVSILPDEWMRSITTSFDSDDPTAVKLEVRTQMPPESSKGFGELSGVVGYMTSEGPDEEVVLFDAIEINATGKAYDATIDQLESGYSEDTQMIVVSLTVSLEELAEIVFLDSDGTPLEVSTMSKSWGGESVTLGFSYDGIFPSNGSVVAKLRRDLKSWEIPFRITNIDFLGRPLK